MVLSQVKASEFPVRSLTSLLCSICLVWILSLALAPPAEACSVCYGDPQSPLTEGAQQGVLTMLIITYTLMIAMMTMFGFVVVRAKRGRTRSGQVFRRRMLNTAQDEKILPPDREQLNS